MKKLYCKGFSREKYPIYFSSDDTFVDIFPKLPNPQKLFIIIDENIVGSFPELVILLKEVTPYIYPIKADEKNKTFSKLESLAKEIFSHKPSRDDAVLAVGGGLVLNLAGLTASLVMRGIPFYYVPTTLTAQIDASIGSKLAVNFMGAKNWIGMYNDPEWCYINANFLDAIPKDEIASQMIEGVKLLLATDEKIFINLFAKLDGFSKITLPHLSILIEELVRAKIKVLDKDLREENYGMSMLYGHTIGHALEMLSSKRMSHGVAVGIGMLAAAEISFSLGLCNQSLIVVHREILKRLKIPSKIPKSITAKSIIDQLNYNKKNYKGEIYFVLLEDVGKMSKFRKKYIRPVEREIILEALDKLY